MCDLSRSLDEVFAAIDRANADDPNQLTAGPRAQVEGRLASDWLGRLDPAATPELQVACRAHHLRRWELARAQYPEGRAGYLLWRRDNKVHQAAATASILSDAGWPGETIERVRQLLSRALLRSDPETQTLEDVACLVFLETQFGPMVERTDHDHMVTIVTKTLTKMSADAIAAAGTLPLDAAGQRVIGDAVTALNQDEPNREP